MPKLWVVRADGGAETQNCVNGGFTGIGWHEIGDLSDVRDRANVEQQWSERADPEDGPASRGSTVGNLSRFLLEIQIDDWIITPESKSRWLRVGSVTGGYFFAEPGSDPCRYAHRRTVQWEKQPIDRWELPGRLQDSLKSAITVYMPSYGSDLFAFLGRVELAALSARSVDGSDTANAVDTVLDRLHEMKAHDFERLIEHLLAAMGFEETETTRASGDGGIDVKGTLNVSNMIRMEVYGQVKRFKKKKRVGEKDIRELRGVIPYGAQGAFFTTGGFVKSAINLATDPRFVSIGLVDGPRLVELLTQHWAEIPQDFRDQLGLEIGLVPT